MQHPGNAGASPHQRTRSSQHTAQACRIRALVRCCPWRVQESACEARSTSATTCRHRFSSLSLSILDCHASAAMMQDSSAMEALKTPVSQKPHVELPEGEAEELFSPGSLQKEGCCCGHAGCMSSKRVMMDDPPALQASARQATASAASSGTSPTRRPQHRCVPSPLAPKALHELCNAAQMLRDVSRACFERMIWTMLLT